MMDFNSFMMPSDMSATFVPNERN